MRVDRVMVGNTWFDVTSFKVTTDSPFSEITEEWFECRLVAGKYLSGPISNLQAVLYEDR